MSERDDLFISVEVWGPNRAGSPAAPVQFPVGLDLIVESTGSGIQEIVREIIQPNRARLGACC